MSETLRSYAAARRYFTLLEIIAWLIIAAGVLLALSAASSLEPYQASFTNRIVEPSAAQYVVVMAPGGLAGLLGLYMIVSVQIARASVDNAEYTQQSLLVARQSLEVSRQLLERSSPPKTLQAVVRDGNTDDTATGAVEEPSPLGAQSLSEMPQILPPGAEALAYKGFTITSQNGTYRVEGQTFFALEHAQEHVDALLKQEG